MQLTSSYVQFHKFNKAKAVLGLSATIDRTVEYEDGGIIVTKGQYLDKYAPVCYTYSLDKARINDINREVDIHIIYNELDIVKKSVKSGNKAKPFYQTEEESYKY